MIRYLITADPVEKWDVRYDSSLRMAQELLARGIPVDYCDLSQMNPANPDYLKELQVRKIEFADPARTPFIGLAMPQIKPVHEYSVILNRKDPPVDSFFRAHAAQFARAPADILQINDPAESVKYSEHELPMDFPQYSIPTLLCESFSEFKQAVRSQKGEAVAKPIDQCSGIGIEFLKNDCSEEKLQAYWDKWHPAIVQPYLEEITRSGDLRILIINKKILGSVMRVPREGSRLANLHQGATGKFFAPTPRQIEASLHIADKLYAKGLYFLGLDYIGEFLSEVNITSPSALVQVNEVTGKNHFPLLINEIEVLRKKKV